MAFMGAESKYIMYNHSSVFNREFPSDDECYSSDYESYWSTAASSSSDADEPASKSQIISRPQTSKSMKSLAKPVSEAEDDDESDCFEDEETIPNDVSKRAENQSENGEEKRPKTAKELAKRFTETVILQPARLVYSAQERKSQTFSGSEQPVTTICPRCRMQITSEVEKRPSRYNWLACFVCVCITPCTWDILKEKIHRCPKCRLNLDEYHGALNEEKYSNSDQRPKRNKKHRHRPRSRKRGESARRKRLHSEPWKNHHYSQSHGVNHKKGVQRRNFVRSEKISPIQAELDRLGVPKMSDPEVQKRLKGPFYMYGKK